MSVIQEVIKDVRRFFGPRSIVNFAHQISEKDQITAAWYVKDARDVHAIGAEMRKLFDTTEAKFKDELRAAQAEMEAEVASKSNNKKGK